MRRKLPGSTHLIERSQFAIFVMPGLVPGIHVLIHFDASKAWMAGTSPAMTTLTRLHPRILTERNSFAHLTGK